MPAPQWELPERVVWRVLDSGQATHPTMDKLQQENFERAFSSGGSGCRGECACGREFYEDSDEWTWNDGELEGLRADKNATCVSYPVSFVVIQDGTYCADCDCWHEKAEKVIAFIFDHRQEIAQFLDLEKQRVQAIADSIPKI